MDKCNALSLLKNNKIKITHQRELLLNYIINHDYLFTVNSLYADLKSEMDIATIYRVLKIFIKKGIVREVYIRDDMKHYELACIHHPEHPHFYCYKCKKVFCLKKLDKYEIDEITRILDCNEAKDISIVINGTCKDCKDTK